MKLRKSKLCNSSLHMRLQSTSHICKSLYLVKDKKSQLHTIGCPHRSELRYCLTNHTLQVGRAFAFILLTFCQMFTLPLQYMVVTAILVM